MEIGGSIHITDVDLPAGVEPTISDRDFTIATIAAPTVLKTLEEEEAEAAAAQEEERLEGEEAVEGEEAEGGKEGEGESGN